MSRQIIFSKDLLYPTENVFEPGSIHVEMLGVNNQSRIPVVIESKTAHSPVKYLESILSIMQSDIFDRILINLKKNVNLYIKTDGEMKNQYGDYEFIQVVFGESSMDYQGANSVE